LQAHNLKVHKFALGQPTASCGYIYVCICSGKQDFSLPHGEDGKKYKRGGVWGVKRKSKMFAEKIKETENQM